MNIEIESVTGTEHGRYYRLSADTVTMTVSVTRHSVTTCVLNASHAAYRSAGKTFHGTTAMTQAMGAYKSSACKAILETVASAERSIVSARESTVEATKAVDLLSGARNTRRVNSANERNQS